MNARLDIANQLINGDPRSLIERIWVDSIQWGPRAIELGDYNLSATLISDEYGPVIKCLSEELKNELQDSLDSGNPRFQVRIRHKGFLTDHDGIWDSWRYQEATLRIWYVYY